MRWCFIDKIDSYAPWQGITAKKAVSFEEFSLLEKEGRQGELPESLLLEACVEALRWLIIRSSDYQFSALLCTVDAFTFRAPACCGDVLRLTATIDCLKSDFVSASCKVECVRGRLAEGWIGLDKIPLEECCDRSLIKGHWKELHGTA